MDVMTLDDGTKVDKPERCPECGYDFMIAEFPDNENGVDRFWLCRNQDCCEEIRPEGIVEKLDELEENSLKSGGSTDT
jgi:ssDNA-binding Zn-finger/Zn-ribbon topoisomerase 1